MSMPQAMPRADWWFCALLADEKLLPTSGVGLKQPGRHQTGYLSALIMRGGEPAAGCPQHEPPPGHNDSGRPQPASASARDRRMGPVRLSK